jgi:hypothetical protein
MQSYRIFYGRPWLKKGRFTNDDDDDEDDDLRYEFVLHSGDVA